MSSFKAVLLCVAFLLPADSALARTWYVNPGGTGDVPTIQAAIDTAKPGDDVLLAPGTYSWTGQCGSGDSMIIMKAGVWLHSEAGAAGTVLDAQWCGRVILCDGVDASSRVQGFTITHGGARNYGGGILCKGRSSLEIIDNVIVDCAVSATYEGVGGGIACIGAASPRIVDNVIRSCDAYRGAGVYCGGSSEPTISGNEISENCTQPPELDWLTFGGGIEVDSASPEIFGNRIVSNWASYGGGINCRRCDLEIRDNLIRGNFAYNNGAAIWCEGGSFSVYRNTIVENEVWEYSWDDGGAVGCSNPSTTVSVMCNIIAGTVTGPAMSCGYDGEVLAWVNDLWNNDGGDADCNTGGYPNYHEDPLFCNPGAGDYTLSEDSRCLWLEPMLCRPQIGAYGAGCVAVSVEQITWGRLKTLYRR